MQQAPLSPAMIQFWYLPTAMGGHLEQAGNPSDPHSFFKPGFPRTAA